MATPAYAEVSWERMSNAVERVRQRLLRAAGALDRAGVPYAVAGGNAVAAWVSRMDEAAVRNTQDVDIVLRRADLSAAAAALAREGFVCRKVLGPKMFLDGERAKARDAVHLVFAGEKVRPQDALPTADVAESEPMGAFRLISLEALVRMKLVAFRDKDRVHLRDLIGVGLVDRSWLDRLPSLLKPRLQALLDNPEG